MHLIDDAVLVSQLMKPLPDRDLVVIDQYFLQGYRLKEIGKELHLSESRISQIKNAALRKMRKVR